MWGAIRTVLRGHVILIHHSPFRSARNPFRALLQSKALGLVASFISLDRDHLRHLHPLLDGELFGALGEVPPAVGLDQTVMLVGQNAVECPAEHLAAVVEALMYNGTELFSNKRS